MIATTEPEATWMAVARAEIGVREKPGKLRNNPRVLEYLAVCTLLSRALRGFDETPWCSAFVNWCMLNAGYEPTRKATAR